MGAPVGGHGAEPDAPFEAADGLFVVPLRTPTLPPATRTNCVVVLDDEAGGAFVIDPASPWAEPRAELDAWLGGALGGRGLRVAGVVLTHHHPDHIGGAAHLAARTGAPVYAHPATAALLGREVAVDVAVGDGQAVGGRLTAVFTPGHAPGHLAFRDRPSGVVIAGDMVAGVGTIVVAPPDGHMGTYLASLERLQAERPAGLVPAHGPFIPGDAAPALLDAYVRHRLWREERVLAGLPGAGPRGAGATAGPGAADLMAVTRAAYADVPAALHPLASGSARAHLDHLVERGLAVRQAGPGGEVWRRA